MAEYVERTKDGRRKWTRRKSEYCEKCGHTILQHKFYGIPSKRMQVICRKCPNYRDCNQDTRVEFSLIKPKIDSNKTNKNKEEGFQ